MSECVCESNFENLCSDCENQLWVFNAESNIAKITNKTYLRNIIMYTEGILKKFDCECDKPIKDHIPDVGEKVETENGFYHSHIPKNPEFSRVENPNNWNADCVVIDKKLKPVDENCLYKPVLTIGSFKEDRSQILVGVYDDVLCIFNKDNLKLEKMCDKDKVYRIPDYDYSDGGNYL